MKTEFKGPWLEALRSGKYEQTRARLKRELYNEDGSSSVGYCCLGVLLEINGLLDDLRAYNGGNLLNTDECKQFGIDHSEQETLANLNDGVITDTGREFVGEDIVADEQCSFSKIADIIERKL